MAVCVMVWVGGCVSEPPAAGGDLDPAEVAEGVVNPFVPAAMRIHPLTHVEVDASGQARIICHLELRDAWGDTTKGVGQLRLELYRLPADVAGGVEARELRWDIDLSDPQRNATLYDAATRTYRVQLIGLPAGVGERTEGAGGGNGRMRLRAELVTRDAHGQPRTLQDEHVVSW